MPQATKTSRLRQDDAPFIKQPASRAFDATKHLWFDAIPAGDKALFWTNVANAPCASSLDVYVRPYI
jgi:hypothetical protein